MKELKPLDYELLFELMKNSRRSDRTLAKVLKSSQPTITRRRAKLEKELIEGYTAIPRWKKLGYEIFAATLVKSKTALATKEKYETVRKKGIEWLMNQPNVIMAGGCRGAGVNAFMISVHKNYSDYDEFMYKYRLELGDTAEDVKTVLINLAGRELLKPLHFKYLTEVK
jgi:DNA-binding Lrp family transcriptional regulator